LAEVNFVKSPNQRIFFRGWHSIRPVKIIFLEIAKNNDPLQAFSQIGVQASCGRPRFEENCFIFHMLPLKLFV